MNQSQRIGWIGTGVMGGPMCGHLMDAGYPMTVYNRSREKAAFLVDRGARWAGTPAEVARQADIVFTMVGLPADVREVYFGENGVLAGARTGSALVDMTTSEPTLAVEIARSAAAQGVSALDAPVSGGDVGARNATLAIMVGGEAVAVARVKPLLAQLGRSIVHQGPAGAGQHAKMCNQIVIAGTMIGVCEAMVYGHRAGLAMETVLESIGGGAAGCWSLQNLAPRILRRDFAPGFMVAHFLKDMGIALAEARRMSLAMPGLA
ncbi:MAG: NAD(P)-dependent oxidoreductase, partial [Desulfosarcinaceae bacterium]